MSAIPIIAVNISHKQSRKRIGISSLKQINRKDYNDTTNYTLKLYEFNDNEQFSYLDTFLTQLGSCIIYLSNEYEDKNKKIDSKKITNLLLNKKDIEIIYIKHSLFQPNSKNDIQSNIFKLISNDQTISHTTHIINTAEGEMPLAYYSIQVLITSQQLLETDEYVGKISIELSSLDIFMRLDSSASDAINLLPKPDHPSQYGSIFGKGQNYDLYMMCYAIS